MAILVRGKTECPICGEVIQDGDDVALFPHFVLNEADPLYPLSDAACHMLCVESDPLGSAMLAASEQCLAETGPGKRICVVCCEEVRAPDDYLLIGYLADPSDDPLGNFNYTHLHKSHIRHWKHADDFLTLARAALAQRKWRGPAIAEVVLEIEAGILEVRQGGMQ